MTRLVTLALMAAAAAVVVTTTSHSHGPARAQVAADATASVVLPNGEPGVVRIVSAQQRGDAILLRVDPVGALGQQTLVVSPGAHVAGTSLQALLAAAAERGNAMHRHRYALSYDVNGAITGITPVQ